MVKKEICVLISFGHKQVNSNGQVDPGAVSGKFVEAQIAEKIANYVWKKILSNKNRKYKVSFPEKDGKGDHLYQHAEQCKVLSKKYRVVSIDIHLNKFNGQAKGIEAWCQKKTGKTECSTYLGKRILNHMDDLGFVNRGVKYNMELQFMKNTGIACLLECGFLDNKSDQKKLDTDRELKAIADKIVLGIEDYVKKYA